MLAKRCLTISFASAFAPTPSSPTRRACHITQFFVFLKKNFFPNIFPIFFCPPPTVQCSVGAKTTTLPGAPLPGALEPCNLLRNLNIKKYKNHKELIFQPKKRQSSYRWTYVPVTRGGSNSHTRAWASLPDQTQKRKKYIRVEKGMRKTTPFRCAASEPARRQIYKAFFTCRKKLGKLTTTNVPPPFLRPAGTFRPAASPARATKYLYHTEPYRNTPFLLNKQKQCASIPVYKTLHGCFLFFATYVMPLTFWSPVG